MQHLETSTSLPPKDALARTRNRRTFIHPGPGGDSSRDNRYHQGLRGVQQGEEAAAGEGHKQNSHASDHQAQVATEAVLRAPPGEDPQRYGPRRLALLRAVSPGVRRLAQFGRRHGESLKESQPVVRAVAGGADATVVRCEREGAAGRGAQHLGRHRGDGDKRAHGSVGGGRR